ncbi:hypothetical protein EUA93_17500 [Nocardioides oleivorans]|uniref:Glycosyltransferase RgtA/B/C/D-like domain-containing protein n=1 Tax=Nocardioides oleivorans TaxID=273676 RepID=A0A4Q2RVN5_9ACTN|nr:hypothetical protein [Nocardioides oleivorans]RYB91919.1 hypothetical protein EUA93_17500 [Nocardioides oleivorans]
MALRLPGWDLRVLYVALLVQGGVAMWLGGRGWFSGDLLHYFVARGGAPGATESLMEPHAAHWQLTLVLFYVVLFKLIGLSSYLPYLAVTVLVHLALVVVAHRLLLRLGAHPLAALASALVLLTYGAGSEAFLVEAPVALTSSMLLGAIAVLLLVRNDHDRRSTVLASVLLLVGCTISLGGVVAAVWVGVFALTRGVWHMLQVVALPAVAFLGWYAVWGRGSTRILLSREETLQVPESAATLLSLPFDNVTGGWGAGPVLVLAVLVAVAYGSRRRPLLVQVTIAGIAGATFHAVVSAVAQLPYGIEQVTTSRYRYVVLLLLLPGLALVLDTLVTVAARRFGRAERRPAVALGLVVVALLTTHAALGQYRVGQSVLSIGDLTRQHLAGTTLAVAAGEKLLTDAVRGSYISGEDLERLADPALREELPDLDPTERDRIEAENNYFVAVTGDELELAPPAGVASDSFAPSLLERAGCRSYTATNATPTLVLTSYLGTGLRFRGDAGSVLTRLSRPDEDVRADPVEWRTTPGAWTYVATTAQLAELSVTFDAGGTYTFCFGD